MTDLDSDLDQLKVSLAKVNSSYGKVEQTMKVKWREICKLDTMEKDLNKLKYLSELPNMFKVALNEYQKQTSQNTGEGELGLFKEPTQYYSLYSDILNEYKQKKFMLSLYGEIKSYVERIKSLLNKALEKLTINSQMKTNLQISEEARLLVSFLLILGEEKSHVRC